MLGALKMLIYQNVTNISKRGIENISLQYSSYCHQTVINHVTQLLRHTNMYPIAFILSKSAVKNVEFMSVDF